MTRKDRWAGINRCVVCGTKLIFTRSARAGTKPEEGSKACSQNHDKFVVHGGYDSTGMWGFHFQMPRSVPTQRLVAR